MIYGIFHGGGSYGTDWQHEDIEKFKDLAEAIEVFDERVEFDPFYPCCDETAEMWVFFKDPSEALSNGSLYPDKIITKDEVYDA